MNTERQAKQLEELFNYDCFFIDPMSKTYNSLEYKPLLFIREGEHIGLKCETRDFPFTHTTIVWFCFTLEDSACFSLNCHRDDKASRLSLHLYKDKKSVGYLNLLCTVKSKVGMYDTPPMDYFPKYHEGVYKNAYSANVNTTGFSLKTGFNPSPCIFTKPSSGDNTSAAIRVTGGTEELRETLMSSVRGFLNRVTSCQIGKGAFVDEYVYGTPEGQCTMTIHCKNGYGIYPKKGTGCCAIERYENGGVRVYRYYGLNEDLPIKSLKEMSNEEFVDHLCSIGFPRECIIEVTPW